MVGYRANVRGRRPSPVGGGAAAVAALPPVLFSFTDSFDSGADRIAERPNWLFFSDDGRAVNGYKVVNSAAAPFEGFGIQCLAGQDLGRVDGGYVEAQWLGGAGRKGVCVNYIDRQNHVYVNIQSASRVQVVRMLNGALTNLIDTAANNPVFTSGDYFGLDYTITSGGAISVTLTRNGVPWPTTANYAGAVNTSAVTGLRPSGLVGFTGQGAANNATANWDNYTARHKGSTPLPYLTLNPTKRVYQRDKDTGGRAVLLSGTFQGVSAVELRVLKDGAVMTGWDWGQKAPVSLTLDATTGKYLLRLPELPWAAGYEAELRDPTNVLVATRTRSLGVGALIPFTGQSNGTPLAMPNPVGGISGHVAPALGYARGGFNTDTTATDFGLYIVPACTTHDTSATSLNNSNAGRLLTGLMESSPAGLPIEVIGLGKGSQKLVNFLSSSTSLQIQNNTLTLFQAWALTLDDANGGVGEGDFEAAGLAQGEDDAGRVVTLAAFGAPEEAAYRANLATFATNYRGLTKGRSSAQCPLAIGGLGRMYSTAPTNTADASWDRFRRMQADLTNPASPNYIPGTFYAHTIDLPLSDTATSQVHRTAAGGIEASWRMGKTVGRAKGWATADRRGPIPTGMVCVGNVCSITNDMQQSSGLVCAQAASSVPTNRVFGAAGATKALGALAFSTPLVPTGYTLSGNQETYTFVETVGAGVQVASPNGVYPDAVNAMKGTQPDGALVMSLPIWVPLVST